MVARLASIADGYVTECDQKVAGSSPAVVIFYLNLYQTAVLFVLTDIQLMSNPSLRFDSI